MDVSSGVPSLSRVVTLDFRTAANTTRAVTYILSFTAFAGFSECFERVFSRSFGFPLGIQAYRAFFPILPGGRASLNVRRSTWALRFQCKLWRNTKKKRESETGVLKDAHERKRWRCAAFRADGFGVPKRETGSYGTGRREHAEKGDCKQGNKNTRWMGLELGRQNMRRE